MALAGWFGDDSTQKAWEIAAQKAQVETERATAVEEADRAAKSEKAAEAATREAQITQSGLLSEAARVISDKPGDGDALLAMLWRSKACPTLPAMIHGKFAAHRLAERLGVDLGTHDIRMMELTYGGSPLARNYTLRQYEGRPGFHYVEGTQFTGNYPDGNPDAIGAVWEVVEREQEPEAGRDGAR